MDLFSSLLLEPHEAISLNGRMYFNMGNLASGLPIEGDKLKRQRGKANHFSVEIDRTRILVDETISGPWYIHNADEIKVDTWRDIIRADSIDDTEQPRRFEIANTPQAYEITQTRLSIIAQSYLRSILIDGWLVPRMSAAKMVGDAAIIFPTYSQTDPDEPTSKQHTVIRGKNWDGKLYRLGKFVWACSLASAEKTYDLLATSGVPFAEWITRAAKHERLS